MIVPMVVTIVYNAAVVATAGGHDHMTNLLLVLMLDDDNDECGCHHLLPAYRGDRRDQDYDNSEREGLTAVQIMKVSMIMNSMAVPNP